MGPGFDNLTLPAPAAILPFMARKPRIHLPGGVYHVMLRGNGGQAIFCCDEDREHLAALLDDGITRFGHRVHAFCWMTNHVHLAIQVATIPPKGT